jgi:hypothetical protein
MDKSALKGALKLSRKAVAELKVAAKMVPDKRRQRDIEIKVFAAEKLLRKVQEQLTGEKSEEIQKEIKEVKQSRFQKLRSDKHFFERTQEALLKIKSDKPETAQRTPPRISGEPTVFNVGTGNARLSGIGNRPGIFKRVYNAVSIQFEKVQNLFRRKTKETLSSYDTDKDSRRKKLS